MDRRSLGIRPKHSLVSEIAQALISEFVHWVDFPAAAKTSVELHAEARSTVCCNNCSYLHSLRPLICNCRGCRGLIIRSSRGNIRTNSYLKAQVLQDTVLAVLCKIRIDQAFYINLAFRNTAQRMTQYSISVVSDTVCPWVCLLGTT